MSGDSGLVSIFSSVVGGTFFGWESWGLGFDHVSGKTVLIEKSIWAATEEAVAYMAIYIYIWQEQRDRER